jgi:hypothetical protein
MTGERTRLFSRKMLRRLKELPSVNCPESDPKRYTSNALGPKLNSTVAAASSRGEFQRQDAAAT